MAALSLAVTFLWHRISGPTRITHPVCVARVAVRGSSTLSVESGAVSTLACLPIGPAHA